VFWRANSKSVLQGLKPIEFAGAGAARLKPCPFKTSVIRIALLAGILAPACRAWGLEPATPLANLNRQGWVMENGLPQNTVQALAQTADGFLWLGTEVGLVRFDGLGFRVFDEHSKPALPSGDVRCLLAAKDGSLWVGTGAGLAQMKDGAVTVFTTKEGLPGNEIRGLSQEDGHLLVVTPNGEIGIEGEKVVKLVDVRLMTTDPRLQPVFSVRTANGELAQATNTEVVLVGAAGKLNLQTGRELPGTRIQALHADREGALWIGTNGGLARYANGKLDKLPVTDPLASASVLSIFEDREGNLWVGTEQNGLQILRDQRFETLTTRDGLASDDTTTVVQDAAGTLWVGTAGNGVTALKPSLNTASPAAARTYTVKNGLASDVILSLAAAPDGDLWVGTPDGLSRIRGGAVVSFTSADGLPDDFIRSLMADADGSLWIGTRRGLTHWTKPGDVGAPMQTYTEANGLGSDLVGAMRRDASGDLWIATFNGLSRLHDGKLTNFTTANGLSSNVITALLATTDGFLLAGTQDHGLNLLDPRSIERGGGRDSVVVPDGRLIQGTGIRAIVDDSPLAHFWFATSTGVARCDRVASGPVRAIACSNLLEFGTADGLRSRETAVNSHPSAWRSADGRLWFATPKGLVAVDPAHFPVNTVAPPVVVERFAVDDADEALGGAGSGTPLEIPAGHNHFQFEYAALSFVAPQKVRYRYMLEGFDHDWTDAGTRRTAYYTNIPPGHYTFRVQAANNDGVWNLEGSALAFGLRPHFYQTAWFYVLVALGLAGLVLLALRLRLLRAEREFRAVLGERNRIAREIHDTLAQGYVGISVQLEVLSELLRQWKIDAAAKQLDATRRHVREGLADARQSIWALRSQDSMETTLPVRMRRMAEQAGGHGLKAQFSMYGAYRPLPPGTENEILRVMQEALHNVKKHAGATNVKVQLEYTSGEIALTVGDDGRGFPVTDNGAGPDSPAGHFGLTGMRERAAAIGGSLEVTSEPGAGTTVRLRAPAPKGAGRDASALQDSVSADAAIPQDAAAPEKVKEQA